MIVNSYLLVLVSFLLVLKKAIKTAKPLMGRGLY
jgi:hypothetical protein